MKKSKLQKLREGYGLSIDNLAYHASHCVACGDIGHMVNTIKTIETGVTHSPRPRKTFEWKALAMTLGCDVEDIYERRI